MQVRPISPLELQWPSEKYGRSDDVGPEKIVTPTELHRSTQGDCIRMETSSAMITKCKVLFLIIQIDDNDDCVSSRLVSDLGCRLRAIEFTCLGI